jgi:hypothetical protein
MFGGLKYILLKISSRDAALDIFSAAATTDVGLARSRRIHVMALPSKDGFADCICLIASLALPSERAPM